MPLLPFAASLCWAVSGGIAAAEPPAALKVTLAGTLTLPDAAPAVDAAGGDRNADAARQAHQARQAQATTAAPWWPADRLGTCGADRADALACSATRPGRIYGRFEHLPA